MRLREVQKIVEATNLGVDFDDDLEIETVCGADLLSDVLAYTKSSSLLLTGLIHSQVIRTAEMLDLRGVVIVRGKEPDEEIIQLAKDKGIPLMRTKLTMFVAAGRLFQAGLCGEGNAR
jgi:predicted transcriptional regulator